MKLLEIKNNLVKLSYDEFENPVLGRFLVLAGNSKSYVAQFINFKTDNINRFAIAKLIFTFSSDGIVDNYDGSMPDVNSKLSLLPSGELLNLLPVETPIKIGRLAQQAEILNLDISVFENNFVVFAAYDYNIVTFISNCVRQLFQNHQKSVIIDTEYLFENYPRFTLCKDFKIPFNSDIIDYFIDVELQNLDLSVKAIISDILLEIQSYIKTLPSKFLPIDSIISVITAQYKETKMPELALLKNKLLKYKDIGLFANHESEITPIDEKLNNKECVIIDISPVEDNLQKEIITYIHQKLYEIKQYSYIFLPVNDKNLDKKLLRKIINNNHVFTTVIANHNSINASELKSHAQNILIFSSQTNLQDFTVYQTFLDKLNPNEGVVIGKLTHKIPFIIDIENLNLDLTKEDVLGEIEKFTPKSKIKSLDIDNSKPIQPSVPIVGEQIVPESQNSKVEISEPENQHSDMPLPHFVEETVIESQNYPQQFEQIENYTSEVDESVVPEEYEDINSFVSSQDDDTEQENYSSEEFMENTPSNNTIEPITNILEDENEAETSYSEVEQLQENSDEEMNFNNSNSADLNSEELTEADLDFIQNEYEQQPEYVVDEFNEELPIYPGESNMDDGGVDIGFSKGDVVTHQKYGTGTVEKIIQYGNKTLCSILFEEVGRRLLDPSISEFSKVDQGITAE